MQSTYRPVNLSFPLWQFLTQPISSSTKVILNPFQFQHHYYIQHLEHCWDYDPVQLLERCWATDMEPESSSNSCF
jgi:hypothetical protein